MKYKRSPLGLTKAERCANYTMRAAKLSMSIKVTLDLCDSMAAHTQISLTNVVEVVDQEQHQAATYWRSAAFNSSLPRSQELVRLRNKNKHMFTL
ncbi:hypothetical protein F443_02467, partial [Phytophthora nicotianae P1569]